MIGNLYGVSLSSLLINGYNFGTLLDIDELTIENKPCAVESNNGTSIYCSTSENLLVDNVYSVHVTIRGLTTISSLQFSIHRSMSKLQIALRLVVIFKRVTQMGYPYHVE